MTDILERLADLPNQPNSVHYQSYVHCIAHDAAEEIKNLRFKIEKLERFVKEYFEGAAALGRGECRGEHD